MALCGGLSPLQTHIRQMSKNTWPCWDSAPQLDWLIGHASGQAICVKVTCVFLFFSNEHRVCVAKSVFHRVRINSKHGHGQIALHSTSFWFWVARLCQWPLDSCYLHCTCFGRHRVFSRVDSRAASRCRHTKPMSFRRKGEHLNRRTKDIRVSRAQARK